jgi:hypothetical protein
VQAGQQLGEASRFFRRDLPPGRGFDMQCLEGVPVLDQAPDGVGRQEVIVWT